jgi:hypothetical protein
VAEETQTTNTFNDALAIFRVVEQLLMLRGEPRR